MTGEDKISIILTVNEWNVVLQMLAKQPYELSAGLIQSISTQAQQQSFASVPAGQLAGQPSSLNGALVEPHAPVSPGQ